MTMRIGRSLSSILMSAALCVPALAQQPSATMTARPAAPSVEGVADPLPRARPEEVGMSSERLAQIGKALKADVERGRIPGAVVAIARKGKLVYFEAFGYRDKANGVPMTTDTIFNIASMTKPVTALGALMLYEQGRLLIDDPLAKYLPKFATMKVATIHASGTQILDSAPAVNR